MTINFGKIDPGGLTASDPGETLYIPFATYNDSGASIAKTGFAVTDIEVFKNLGDTPRATDSGYSLIGDTGQLADRVGLNRFSIGIFNTSDDPDFFEAGAQYQVAVDSITVDGRTVRFYPAIFQLGTVKANVTQIDGDTGAAAHVQQAFASQAVNSDTGLIANAAAIRTKTDSLTFTQPGAVDANVTHINETEVGGTGAAGDRWGPA